MGGIFDDLRNLRTPGCSFFCYPPKCLPPFWYVTSWLSLQHSNSKLPRILLKLTQKTVSDQKYKNKKNADNLRNNLRNLARISTSARGILRNLPEESSCFCKIPNNLRNLRRNLTSKTLHPTLVCRRRPGPPAIFCNRMHMGGGV